MIKTRGLSNIVVVVLTILLVLVAAGLIWTVYNNFSSSSLQKAKVDQLSALTKLSIDDVSLDDVNKVINILVSRAAGSDAVIAGITVILTDINGNTAKINQDVQLNELESKLLKISYSNTGLDKITTIEVYPIFSIDGKNLTGSVGVSKDVSSLNISPKNQSMASPSIPVNAIYLNSCGNINSSGYYVLNKSIDSTNTCLIINSDNVVLDGNGYSLTGGMEYGEAGVMASGNYLSLKNLNINRFFRGMKITGSNERAFDNLIGNFGDIGIDISGTNNSVKNNTITGSGTYGISIDGLNNFVTDNSICNVNFASLWCGPSSTTATGTGNMVNLIKNTPYGGLCSNNWPILGRDYILCEVNPLPNAISLSSCGAISSPGYYVLNQSVSTNGTCFTIVSNDVILDGNGYTISGNSGGNGISSSGVSNLTIKKLNILRFANGLYFISNGLQNSRISNVNSNLNGVGLTMYGSRNNLIVDSNISLNNLDVSMLYGSTNNTFLNVSALINDGDISAGSQLIRKWFTYFKFSDINGNPVAGANLSLYNSKGELQFSLLTDSNGKIPEQQSMEYIINNAARTSFNPYTLNVFKRGQPSQCSINSDCPPINCIKAPCPVNTCVNGQCVQSNQSVVTGMAVAGNTPANSNPSDISGSIPLDVNGNSNDFSFTPNDFTNTNPSTYCVDGDGNLSLSEQYIDASLVIYAFDNCTSQDVNKEDCIYVVSAADVCLNNVTLAEQTCNGDAHEVKTVSCTSCSQGKGINCNTIL